MDILELFKKMGLGGLSDIVLMPINFTRETVTKFNLQTMRRTLEIVSATWYANADRAYPENLEVKQFAQHLSPIPKVMLNLSIKEGNDSNQVTITESADLTPTGSGNVGGYLYNPLEGLIKINHAGKDLSGVLYNEY
ncbi:hypothetical protein HY792_02650 [Candidatus Desantisbacteria bacterium]|nr:hypothetical protein [Candidatus Desantisbacteria bacterium]